MTRFKKLIGLLLMAALLFTAAAGCNTIAGMGKDIEATGRALTGAAD